MAASSFGEMLTGFESFSTGEESVSAENRLNEVITKLPKLYKKEDRWEISEKLEDDKIYWTNFDGTDSDAEIIEKLTGLSFLGDSLEQSSNEVECCISGKPTNRKIYLAKTY